MGTVVYVTSADPKLVANADDRSLCDLLTGPDAWELDTLWWVPSSLLLPELDLIDGDAVVGELADVPVLCLEPDTVRIKLSGLEGLDRDELMRRFLDGHWRRIALGPEPRLDDAEWIVEAAVQLLDVYRDAARDGHVVLTALV